jgi:hypothetical protein
MRSKLIACITALVAVGGAVVFVARPEGAWAAVDLPGEGSWGQHRTDHLMTQCSVSLPGGRQIVVPDAVSNEGCIQMAHTCLQGRMFTEIKWKDAPKMMSIQPDTELCTQAEVDRLHRAD